MLIVKTRPLWDPTPLGPMALCRRPGGYPLKEIARTFRMGNYASVSVAIRRLQDRLREDRALGRELVRLGRSLFGE